VRTILRDLTSFTPSKNYAVKSCKDVLSAGCALQSHVGQISLMLTDCKLRLRGMLEMQSRHSLERRRQRFGEMNPKSKSELSGQIAHLKLNLLLYISLGEQKV
jgi:hypothetical protein